MCELQFVSGWTRLLRHARQKIIIFSVYKRRGTGTALIRITNYINYKIFLIISSTEPQILMKSDAVMFLRQCARLIYASAAHTM